MEVLTTLYVCTLSCHTVVALLRVKARMYKLIYAYAHKAPWQTITV
jgi:hypothetical protein